MNEKIKQEKEAKLEYERYVRYLTNENIERKKRGEKQIPIPDFNKWVGGQLNANKND